jgi:CDP-diacylglycerol--serine O-phosphatidyltransferase
MNEKLKSRKMRRGAPLLPTLFTVGNIVCGYYALVAAMRGGAANFDAAAKAIGIAIVLDGLDGRVARLTGATSPFGKEFDSLADVISFGLAPAFLAYSWGLFSLEGDGDVFRHLIRWGGVITFAFLMCGAWRLARFNIQATDGPNHVPFRHFVGLPIPAAAGMIAALVHFRKSPLAEWTWAAAWLGLVAGLAFLMVSTVRYYSFKDIDLRRRRSSLVVVALGLLVILIVTNSEIVLPLLAIAYVLSGIIAKVSGWIRRRPGSSPTAAGEPAELPHL